MTPFLDDGVCDADKNEDVLSDEDPDVIEEGDDRLDLTENEDEGEHKDDVEGTPEPIVSSFPFRDLVARDDDIVVVVFLSSIEGDIVIVKIELFDSVVLMSTEFDVFCFFLFVCMSSSFVWLSLLLILLFLFLPLG